jgi:hypothetical protein
MFVMICYFSWYLFDFNNNVLDRGAAELPCGTNTIQLLVDIFLLSGISLVNVFVLQEETYIYNLEIKELIGNYNLKYINVL